MGTISNIMRKKVESSKIESIGYDKASMVLEVEFKSKKSDKPNPVYRYTPVTEELYLNILRAESIGTYFHYNVEKNNQINCKKLEA